MMRTPSESSGLDELYNLSANPSPMKVLAISGSPRKDGNTDYALKSILRTLEEDAKAETEFLSIVDHEIEHAGAAGTA